MLDNPLQRLLKRLNLTQGAVAKIMKTTQQTVSRHKRLDSLSDNLRKSYIEELSKVRPGRKQLIQDMLKGHLKPVTADAFQHAKSMPRHSRPSGLPEIEPEALPWAYAYRNRCLFDRITHIAQLNGAQAERVDEIPDGLIVRKGKDTSFAVDLSDVLFPHSKCFGVPPNTLILLGCPFRHPLSDKLLEGFSSVTHLDINFQMSRDDVPFFFGYPTRFVHLEAEKDVLQPTREMASDGTSDVLYTDYGVICHAPLEDIVDRGDIEFLEGTERALMIMGCHRLATGVGWHLAENPNLLKLLIDEQTPFKGKGAFTYKVVARGGTRHVIEDLSLEKRFK